MAQSIYSDNVSGDVTLNANATSQRLGVTEIFEYPPDIGSKTVSDTGGHVPFVMFFPYERPMVRDTSDLFSASLDALDKLPPSKFCIALPLPSSAVKTKYSVVYESVSLGAAGAIATAASNLVNDPTTSLISLAATVTQNADKFLTAYGKANPRTPSGMVAQGMGSLVTAVKGAGGEQLAAASLGVSTNPFTEQLFKSVDYRTHEFSYTFIPKNEKESKIVDDIVKTFRFYMLPSNARAEKNSTVASAILSFPYEFQILYSVRNTTFMLFPSVLESLDVDYGSDLDAPKFFEPSRLGGEMYPTQYPVKTTISMKFRELVILSRERVTAPNQVLANDSTYVGKDKLLPGNEALVKRYRF